MAIFGFHMVVTLVAASIFSKISYQYIFCDFFIFKGLNYYLLRNSLFVNNVKNNKNLKQIKQRKQVISKELANLNEENLFRLPLACNVLEGVPFFDSLIWTINYSCVAIMVYAISDLFNLTFPGNKDFNTSIVWILCALALQMHVLMRITFEKASTKELYPERNTIICAFGLFFLLSMLLNVFCDEIMDINFVKGYKIFVNSLNEYIVSKGFGPLFIENARSPLLFLVCLALLYSFIAASFFFPILQFTSLYINLLEECAFPKRLLLQISFFTPVAAISLFLKPVVEQILNNYMLSYEQLKTLRVLIIYVMIFLRIYIAKIYLQIFLDQPKKKIIEYMQLKDQERQKKIAYFASYTCITSLQYYLPVLIIFFTSLVLKNLGTFSFLSLFGKESLDYHKSLKQPHISKIIMNKELQEPLWTLTLMTFMTVQFLISIIGVIGKRSFL